MWFRMHLSRCRQCPKSNHQRLYSWQMDERFRIHGFIKLCNKNSRLLYCQRHPRKPSQKGTHFNAPLNTQFMRVFFNTAQQSLGGVQQNARIFRSGTFRLLRLPQAAVVSEQNSRFRIRHKVAKSKKPREKGIRKSRRSSFKDPPQKGLRPASAGRASREAGLTCEPHPERCRL
ncbi:hypothetical protein J2X91_004892 [Agrobacterium tumefaciens]|nr:hypothetical protein [Agrobacterium tumefaciens]